MEILAAPVSASEDFVIPIPSGIDSDAFILAISQANEGIRIEQTSPDQLTLMPPAGFQSSDLNSEIGMQLRIWTKQNRRGRCVDSNTLFSLPNGSKLGPDAAWISNERLGGLTAKDKKKFIHRAPEFVIELLSPSDSKPKLRRKMQTWLDQGVLLGWLMDPTEKSIEIYRSKQSGAETVKNISTVLGDGPMAGFVLELSEIWNEPLG